MFLRSVSTRSAVQASRMHCRTAKFLSSVQHNACEHHSSELSVTRTTCYYSEKTLSLKIEATLLFT